MNILLISLDFPPNPGGVAVFLHNICVQFCRMGHLVDVLAPMQEGCVEVDAGQSYRVYRYGSSRWVSSIVPTCYMLALHGWHHYDVVFVGHSMTTHAIGALVLRKLWGVPYIILSHGNDLHYCISNWMDEPIAYQLLQNASLVLSNSYVTAERVRQKGYRGPLQVLHPGVDAEEFRPDIETSEIDRRYDLDGRKVILSVSRLVARKGHDRVLRALPSVVRQIPDALYLIAGRGEEESRLRALVDELGLEEHVTFAGYVKQETLSALYCACDLLVMPSFERDGRSDYEGFGIVFLEANACGKPVIGGRSGGTMDAVIDGETGLLVDPDDEDTIAEAITDSVDLVIELA